MSEPVSDLIAVDECGCTADEPSAPPTAAAVGDWAREMPGEGEL